MKELEERCVYEWNFAANLVNILQRHYTCLTKHTGRTVWAKHSAMSGLSILKRTECRSLKIPGLDNLPHNKRRPCRESSCCDSWKSLFNCMRSCWRSGHQHRILPSNFYWKTSDVLRQCKIHARLLTDDQKENCLEISQELLVNANGNENFLKNIITGDETWVYECDVETKMQASQWMGKGSPWLKKAHESVKDQGDVGCVFLLERYCPSWMCTTWSDGKQTVVSGSFSTFEGCCAQEEAWIVGKPDLDVAPQQCASLHVAPHPQLSGKASDIHCALSTLFSGLSPSRLFPVSQTSNHFERTSFPNHIGDSGKCNKRTTRHQRKCIPGSILTVEETLGTAYHQ